MSINVILDAYTCTTKYKKIKRHNLILENTIKYVIIKSLHYKCKNITYAKSNPIMGH